MQVDPRARFDNFVVGTANRLAVAAAHAVAEAPGAVYNPLFIYSSSGLGKTHLIGAIGNHAIQRSPDLSVEYVALEDFVQQLNAAIASGEMERFKQRYGRVDLLLVDDVQFLTGRRETQSELLRLLTALQGSGRQIIMTGDRPPAEIADVDERLISRLSGGLIVDIGAPDFETRVAILREKCEERSMSFAAGVLEELARVEFANIRELQGAMNRLGAHQSLDGTMTPSEVRDIVGAPLHGLKVTVGEDVIDTRGCSDGSTNASKRSTTATTPSAMRTSRRWRVCRMARRDSPHWAKSSVIGCCRCWRSTSSRTGRRSDSSWPTTRSPKLPGSSW